MLTSKIIIEIIEKLNFLGARKAAINLFQDELDKPWNYLWYCYEKQWCLRWSEGVASAPQKFWFADNLSKSPENPGKNGAQCCLTSKNGAQCLHENTRDLILEVTPKTGLHDLCGRNFIGKSCTKTFRASLGKFGQNFAPQKFACFYSYDEKSPPPPLPLDWKGIRGKALTMPAFSGASVHIILALSLLVVVCHVSLQWT